MEIIKVSTAVKVGETVPPVIAADKISVPAAPFRLSNEFKVAVAPAEPPKEPSKVSAPDLPVKLFRPVVSDLRRTFISC